MNHDCLGCSACRTVCPTESISMEPDLNGYLKPQINHENCISCGKCEQVCPMIHDLVEKNEAKEVYFFVNDSQYERNLSSSGGFFIALAKWIIEKQGVVFGAVFTSAFLVEHTFADRLENVLPMLGSKYVQSDLKFTFQNVSEKLEDGKWVLYTGTPCQIAGLRNFLELEKKDTEKLVTMDVFCHGVPSQSIWKSYLNDYHGKEEIRYIQFRNKLKGWWECGLKIQYAHSDYFRKLRSVKDPYLNAFNESICLNSACYNCLFRTHKKHSDFYVGDAWNINKVRVNMEDGWGVTTVVVNSLKAQMIMQELAKESHCYVAGLEDGFFARKELFEQKKMPEIRETFLKDYRNKGFRYAVEKNLKAE